MNHIRSFDSGSCVNKLIRSRMFMIILEAMIIKLMDHGSMNHCKPLFTTILKATTWMSVLEAFWN